MRRRWLKLWVFVGTHHTTLTGVLIVLVTVFGAYVTSQAASASGTGSDLDQRGRQARIERSQILGGIDSTVSYERGLFAAYQREVQLAGRLQGEAQRARAGATSLKQAAEEERAVARALQSLFFADLAVRNHGRTDRPRYEPDYRRTAAIKNLKSQAGELTALRPAKLEHAAARARDKRLWLMGVDTALIGSLFFLTLALLGVAFRPGFALTGVVFGALAVVGYVAVELLVKVPAA